MDEMMPEPHPQTVATHKRAHPLSTVWRLCMWLFVLAGIGLVALSLFIILAPLDKVPVYQTTTIYSYDGEPLTQLYGKGINRQVIPLSEIPASVITSTLAIEDRGFYDHVGFDFKRMGKAAWEDLKRMKMVQGASTITQQLARNLYLSHDKTWERKIKEAIITLQLETRLSKDEILHQYLNQIYYGEASYGIQAAAQTYFAKDARDLTLAEATLLVGIPKNPSAYSPFRDWEMAKKRQRQVLQALVDVGEISEETALKTAQEEVALAKPQSASLEAPYFLDYIILEAKEKFGLTFEQINNGGYRIYTTIDPDMQAIAEEVIEEELPAGELQAALVAIEPFTGAIRAMVGGRDYEQSQFNRALALRQPGSSFKAFLYTAALEQGWTPITLQESEPAVFPYDGGTYSPQNFGDQYAMRAITMREAIAHSDNIYAVKTHLSLGESTLVEMAHRLGIESPLQPLPSLALGAEEVTPLEMTSAYATLANQGKHIPPTAIIQIADAQGNVVAQAEPRAKQVISPQVAYVMTHLLQGVFAEGGTGHRVSDLVSRPVAGKTGTTNFDAWLSGYTPELAVSVWVGFDDHRNISTMESRSAAPIWAKFMEKALADHPPALFSPPEGIVNAYVDPHTGMLATEQCPLVSLEVFIEGTTPTEFCTEHVADEDSSLPESPEKQPFKQLFRWIFQ